MRKVVKTMGAKSSAVGTVVLAIMLALLVSAGAVPGPVQAGDYPEAGQIQLAAEEGTTCSWFGSSVAVSGETLIIGAMGANVGPNRWQGAAYVFVREGNGWARQARLTASDGAPDDSLGSSVAISGDTAIVGARFDDVGPNENQGAAYVFVRNGSTWTQQAKLTASGGCAQDVFGTSVAISGDTAVVGAMCADVGANLDKGTAYVFLRTGNTWSQQARLAAADGSGSDWFGTSVAINGDSVIVGDYRHCVAPGGRQGAAHVFVRSGTDWTEEAELAGSDSASEERFGWSVAIDGDSAVIGSVEDAIGPNLRQGSAYVFVRTGNVWSEQTKLIASDGEAEQWFGASVAISGDTAVVGSPLHRVGSNAMQGAAYVFLRSGTTWTEQTQLVGSDGGYDDWFGCSVAIEGDTAVVGAWSHDVGANAQQGSAYVFEAVPGAGNPAAVSFPDPNLEAVVRARIGKPTGDIGASDLEKITSLYGDEAGIVDITGLEHCTSLETLSLERNRIRDLSPLADLARLRRLDLQSNQISDISPLGGLTSLRDLDLARNPLSDLSALSGLTGLDSLCLYEDQISDLSPLSGLNNLRELYLIGNGLSDLSPLSGLASLDSLYLTQNNISDLSPLSTVSSLTLVLLPYNQISDLSPVSSLPNLGYLDVSGNQISDLKPMVDNPQFGSGRLLDVTGNPLSAESINTFIPVLVARGAHVRWDLPAPGLVSPGNGTVTGDSTPDLDWSTVTAGSSVHYELQVDDNPDFSSPVVNETSVSDSSYTVTTPLADGTYYWNVRAADAGGAVSAWTGTWSFTVESTVMPMPALVSPSDRAMTTDHTQYLDWSTVTTASSVHYQLQVSRYPNFSSTVVNKTWVSRSYCATPWLAHGTYYWRVRTADASGSMSAWTPPWSFTVAPVTPRVPVLVSPSNGAVTTDHTPYLDWSTITTGSSVHYQLQVSRDASFSSTLVNRTWVSRSCCATPWLADGVYYWRVRAVDASGSMSAWTTARAFAVA